MWRSDLDAWDAHLAVRVLILDPTFPADADHSNRLITTMRRYRQNDDNVRRTLLPVAVSAGRPPRHAVPGTLHALRTCRNNDDPTSLLTLRMLRDGDEERWVRRNCAPLDVVDTIVPFLRHDLPALLACDPRIAVSSADLPRTRTLPSATGRRRTIAGHR